MKNAVENRNQVGFFLAISCLCFALCTVARLPLYLDSRSLESDWSAGGAIGRVQGGSAIEG